MLHYNFAHEFVPMKRSQESSSPNFALVVKTSARCLVSRHSVSVRQNSSSKPQNPRSTRLSSVNLGRKEYELRMLFCSANFGNRELRMVQKTLEICLSETHASGNREV